MTKHSDTSPAGRLDRTANPTTNQCAGQDIAPGEPCPDSSGRHPSLRPDQLVDTHSSAERSQSRSISVAGPAAAPGLANQVEAAAAEAPPIFHTVEEVARTLGVSSKTIRRRIQDGVIRKVPMGGRLVRIASTELQRLAADTRVKPAAPSGQVSIP